MEDASECADFDCPVPRNYSRAVWVIPMPIDEVASFWVMQLEAMGAKKPVNFPPGDWRQPDQAATSTVVSSSAPRSSGTGRPSIRWLSRYASTASTMLFKASSRVSPWLETPTTGQWTTKPPSSAGSRTTL